MVKNMKVICSDFDGTISRNKVILDSTRMDYLKDDVIKFNNDRKFFEKNINTIDIVIKPHHLLDIFKLYGKGIENFIPDKNYNHNFYLIGNAVIRNEVNKIRFTYSYDDICKPCYYLKNSVCNDYFSVNGIDINKNKYNEKLDIRLMELLNLKFDEIYEFKNIIKLLNNEVSLTLINLAWYSSNQEDNKIRYKLTKKGIETFLSKY